MRNKTKSKHKHKNKKEELANCLAVRVKTSNHHKQCLEIDSGGATGTEM